VQSVIAALRAQAAGDRVAEMGPLIVRLAERYPELRGQASFEDMRKHLIETEDRIALARAYHSNVATFYNTRIERVPDRYVAALVRMTPESLFQLDGFERQSQKLTF